jgi:hypothetical protein
LEFGVWSLEPIGPGFVGLYLSSLTAVPWLSRNRQKRAEWPDTPTPPAPSPQPPVIGHPEARGRGEGRWRGGT